MNITFTLEGDPLDMDEERDIEPEELASLFSTTAEWAVEELGAQQVRDLLEAVIALGGAERN